MADAACGDPLTGAIRAAAVHSAALVLVNAAQHLQRTTLLVEAATARALVRAPDGGGGEGDPDTDRAMFVARAALAEAQGLFEAAQAGALALASELRGT